jgi:ABC-type multidrug transport system ATPase subunit
MQTSSITANSPIKIELIEVAKKFQSEWIFKNVHLELEPVSKLVILGGNGSGKSTLLQVISTAIGLNKGQVIYSHLQQKIANETIHQYISFASPYLQLIEEFTLRELILHIEHYKPFIGALNVDEVMNCIALPNIQSKYIRQYSSGMKQRVKLALAILADCPVLLLDEPVSNLDKNAIKWYQTLMEDYATYKTVIICSNSIEAEYEGITRFLDVSQFKHS